MVKIIDLALRAVTDFFEMYTIHSLIKNVFKVNFIMFKLLFRVAQPKQNRQVIIIVKRKTGSRL